MSYPPPPPPSSGPGLEAPASPSWSVPLHRPPPGVMYDTPPTGNFGMGGYAYPPPPPPPPEWSGPGGPGPALGSGPGPGPSTHHHRTSGEWYLPTADGHGYHSQPPHVTARQSVTPVQSNGDTEGTPEVKAAGKKKRKKGSPDDKNKDKDKDKRTKTGRACDACRTKKIRCDILPPEEALGRDALCAHCKQYGLECTFFLPITETRFKKRRQTEDGYTGQLSENASLAGRSPASRHELPLNKPREVPARLEAKGPTSLSFLLHTSLPASTSEAYDLRNHNKWEISEDGNGLIRVNAPPSATGQADADPDDPSYQHNRLNRPILSSQTISALVNAYFDHLAPLFPVVSRADFTAKANPSPLLLYSICGLAATMRQFPREVFSGVRGVINGLLRSNDILSDARFEHVQALLLLGQAGDLHAQPTAATASASLIRMGTATRMAQDLGLHRESNLRAQTAQDLAYVELRRRVWAACVIFDRWYGAALGIPLLIDLCDCDVLLPAPYEVIPEEDPSTWPIEPSFMALAEHLKLSILVGRVLKTIYSPTGLKHATDHQLESLLADMDAWLVGLPDELQYKGPQSSHMAGMLHLGHCAMQFLFWRVFMRITYICPPHLTISLKIEQWSKLVLWGQECIHWLHHNDTVLDTLFIYPYTATNAALIQYHTWARRKDPTALESLKTIKEVAASWERKVQPDQMSIRRKTCETMTLLYEAALKTTSPGEEGQSSMRPGNVNPTAGVRMREDFGRTVFLTDPNRPGGGIFVAQNQDEKLNAGLQQNDVVLASELQNNGANANASGDVNGGGRMVPNGAIPDPAPPGLEVLQGMQTATSNVNPNINIDLSQVPSMPTDAGMVLSDPGQDLFNGADSTGFDASLLEGLPLSQFNCAEWNSYFEQMDKMQSQSQPQPNGGMQGMSGQAMETGQTQGYSQV